VPGNLISSLFGDIYFFIGYSRGVNGVDIGGEQIEERMLLKQAGHDLGTAVRATIMGDVSQEIQHLSTKKRPSAIASYEAL